MYPVQCAGGYPVPVKMGKMEVWGMRATVKDPTADSRLTIIDDVALGDNVSMGRILTDDYTNKVVICDLKGVANAEGTLYEVFPEPIKVRRGVSIINASNVEPGKNILYVR
jgi:hypothetical protein